MDSFEQKLEKYAQLVVEIGLNIQKGQTLVVTAPITSADFVRTVAKKAYEAGAKNVFVEWDDEELSLIRYLHAPDEAFSEYPTWRAKGLEEMADQGAAFLVIKSPNPDLLKDVNPDRVAAANKATAIAMKKFKIYTQTGRNSWTIVSIPTKEWSAKIFPGMDEKERMEKLWDLIFRIARADAADPVHVWKKHLSHLNEKLGYLNTAKFRKLYFKAPGTNLEIELPEKHLWAGGYMTNEKGIHFVPNIPTEEVFTLPKKDGVNGVVSSTKPLNYNGSLIENFTLTFEKGRIVDFTAERGYETLKKLIETDEGSRYLGEIALVPQDSPVSLANVIFYNTLFDENASCHLAIGNAYPLCLDGGTRMTPEELQQNGANMSLVHVDFMIGSQEMNIDGETADGQIVPLFRNGNWVR